MNEVELSRSQLIDARAAEWYASPAYRELMAKQEARRAAQQEVTAPVVGPVALVEVAHVA